MRRLIPFVLVLALACCSPKLTVVDQRGKPLPNERLLFTSTFGLRADLVFYRVYEESEECFVPEFLPLDEKNWLSANTKAVSLQVHVTNRYKDKIELIKVVSVRGQKDTRSIYIGRDQTKTWTLSGPVIPDETITLATILKVDGRMIFITEGIYRIRKEVRTTQQAAD